MSNFKILSVKWMCIAHHPFPSLGPHMDTEQEKRDIAVEDYKKIVLFRHSREVAHMNS